MVKMSWCRVRRGTTRAVDACSADGSGSKQPDVPRLGFQSFHHSTYSGRLSMVHSKGRGRNEASVGHDNDEESNVKDSRQKVTDSNVERVTSKSQS